MLKPSGFHAHMPSLQFNWESVQIRDASSRSFEVPSASIGAPRRRDRRVRRTLSCACARGSCPRKQNLGRGVNTWRCMTCPSSRRGRPRSPPRSRAQAPEPPPSRSAGGRSSRRCIPLVPARHRPPRAAPHRSPPRARSLPTAAPRAVVAAAATPSTSYLADTSGRI